MNNINLLNAFLFFGYYFLVILGAVLSVIILPLRIIHAFYSMDMSDAFAYSRFLIHSKINNLKNFGVTLKLTIDKQTPNVSVRSYDEEAKEASEKINKKRHASVRSVIADGLKIAQHFNYVIFQKNESNIMFIQIHLDTGVYLFDFPLTRNTLNRDYAIDMIKFFRRKGFAKNADASTIYRNKTYSIDSVGDEMSTIQANLGTESKYVISLSTEIFTKIFSLKTIPVVVFG